MYKCVDEYLALKLKFVCNLLIC